MPIFSRLTRITVLAAALSGGSTILIGLARAQPAEEREAPTGKPCERPRPAPSGASPVELASDSNSSRPQCRIYFGCPPAPRPFQQ